MVAPLMRLFPLACLALGAVGATAQEVIQAGTTPASAAPVPPSQIKLKATVAAPPGPDGKPGDVLTVPQVSVASGSEGKVSVSGPTKPPVPGQAPVPPTQLEFSFTPTLLPSGEVSISLHASLPTSAQDKAAFAQAQLQAAAEKERERRGRPGRERTAGGNGVPVFHSVLPSEGLFSLADDAGHRRWVKVGQAFAGWTLESYDEKHQVLTIAKEKSLRELTLFKSVVEAGANDIVSSVTVQPGQNFVIGSANGTTITLSVEVIKGAALPAK
jgi:hypothetical protein